MWQLEFGFFRAQVNVQTSAEIPKGVLFELRWKAAELSGRPKLE